MIRFLLLFCSLLCSLTAAEEEIVVHLARSSPLEPVYLDALQGQKAGLDQSYLGQLEKVLRFDLNHNGKNVVVERKNEWIQLCKEENGIKNFVAEKWAQAKIHAVVKGEVIDKTLSVFLLAVKGKKIKGIEGIKLSGEIAADRRKIHEIADLIHESLYGEKGIASTRILYTVRTRSSNDSTEWQTDVWEADYDGASARRITRDGKLCVTPAYIARPGARPKDFLYVSYKTGQPKIYISSLQKSESKRLTLLKGNQLMPQLSPKRDMIAFISDILGNPEVFVQRFDPSNGMIDKPWQVTSFPGGAQGSPTFSADGKKIAFVSNKDGAARIYVSDVPPPGASAKGLKLNLISKKNRENTCPVWSPDGTKIAYSAKTKGTRQIWVYDFKTGQETQLTEGSGDKENPSWAPNSCHLVYHSTTSNTSELYLIHLNHIDSTKITSQAGEKRFPVWEPFSS